MTEVVLGVKKRWSLLSVPFKTRLQKQVNSLRHLFGLVQLY